MGARELLLNAASKMRKLASRVAELEAQVQKNEKLEEAEKIASSMAQRGILPLDQVRTTAQKWIDEERNLSVLEEAIKVAEKMPNMTWAGSIDSASAAIDPETKVINFIMGNRD